MLSDTRVRKCLKRVWEKELSLSDGIEVLMGFLDEQTEDQKKNLKCTIEFMQWATEKTPTPGHVYDLLGNKIAFQL